MRIKKVARHIDRAERIQAEEDLIDEAQSLIDDALVADPNSEKTASLILWCKSIQLSAQARIEWWDSRSSWRLRKPPA